ncbi:MarR family winged helix-turn-helix transcriptional regulator [Martelella soudanensis]|uniref:MarR family winged helix-turn-helix transcriptional regulator n=1 Tax=unclassified Martelella TaxID=2629616 RepID=UPI0015DE244B|nr:MULTISPECIES: MarR family transcriptional regulator [unclassified Martelella]
MTNEKDTVSATQARDPEPVDALDPRQAPSFYIKLLSQELTRIAEAGLRPLGLGMGSLHVLTALKTGEASTQADLVKLLHVEQPSMAQMLARLERDGLIARSPHPSNGRLQLIELTPVAKSLLPRSKEILMEGNKRALADFSGEETQHLLALLKRMHRNLSGGVNET